MAYDTELADRIRAALGARDDLGEKQMFGGLAFLLGGHLAVAASGQGGLLVRCDPDMTDHHLEHGAEQMIMRGQAVNGWLRIPVDLIADDACLERWVGVGTTYTAGLRPK